MATSSQSAAPRLDASVLKFQTKPHPRFWLGNDKLRAVVRERLLKIAAAYQQHLALPKGVPIEDITFTGSLTGRNYTSYSDVDIHFIVDYDRVGDEALVTDYFDLKRKEWSSTYPVTVYGFPVEIYVQSASQFTDDPAGHYSLRKNRWVRPVPEPDEQQQQVTDQKARALAAEYALEARQLLKEASKTKQLTGIKEFISRFKSLRQRGITSKAGIYSPENLAFKILRNSGSLDKLWDTQSDLEAQALTLTEHFHHSPMNYLLTEAQVATLQRALHAERTFLAECASQHLLDESALLTEGVLDTLTEKIKTLLGAGGAPLLRKTLLAAVMGGSLLLSPDAIAQAAKTAGMDQAQLTQLTSEIKQAQAKQKAGASQSGASYTAALQELHQRYVIDNADPAKTKQYMRFTGNLADVIGIGKNGYPLFKAGSASQQALDAAFASPQVVSGVASMPGSGGSAKEFAGKFVKANGLYYVYTQSAPAPGPTVAASPAATPATAAPTPGDQGVVTTPEKGYMYDFSGIFQQAKLRYEYKKRPNGAVVDDVFNGAKTYTNLAEYTRDFIRRSGFGLESYSDAQFDSLFADGPKVRVPKLPQGQIAKR